MKLIVGLGNPGSKYEKTRHNVGYMLIDHIAKLLDCQTAKKSKLYLTMKQCNNETILLVKPLTFMNKSGQAVKEVLKNSPYSVKDLIVVHDDLDIKLGEWKIQKGKGPKIHNGILSIEEAIGKDFIRIRIGVDNRAPENRIPGEAYVLQNFTEEELEITKKVFGKITSTIFNF
jgi:peptidyl-tRNA hydrolase, PTH1 family